MRMPQLAVAALCQSLQGFEFSDDFASMGLKDRVRLGRTATRPRPCGKNPAGGRLKLSMSGAGRTRRHPRRVRTPGPGAAAPSSKKTQSHVIIMLPRLWVYEVAYVGRASRLTSNDLRLQAGRPHYIPEVQKLSDFGITVRMDGFFATLRMVGGIKSASLRFRKFC